MLLKNLQNETGGWYMRESLKDIDRLEHIKERIGNVMNFLEGKTFEDMKSNVMCYHAVVHNYKRF